MMRTGVVFCGTDRSDLRSSRVIRVGAKLQSLSVPILLCGEHSTVSKPNEVREFVVVNNLQGLVVFCPWKAPALEALRDAVESAGLKRQAVSYCASEFLLGGYGYGGTDSASTIALVNLARIEHADHLKDVVFRTVLSSPKVSRRALLRSIPKVLRVESDIPAILRDGCGPRFASCHYCRDACDFKAIAQNAEGLTIDYRLCTECGACARDCPLGAIQCPSISDAQFLAMVKEFSEAGWNHDERLLVLTCEVGMRKFAAEMATGKSLKLPTVPVTVPCVGSIGSHLYLWAASQGVRLVTVCADTSCVNFKALAPIQSHVESYRRMLGERSVQAESSTIQHLSLARDGSIIDSLSQFAKATVHFEKLAELPWSGRRGTTLNAARMFRTDGGERDQLPLATTLPFFDLAIDGDKCTFCESCQRDCPDQAIRFAKDENSSRLMFDPSLCGGCRICEDKCPEKAIVIARLTGLSDILHGNASEKVRDEVAKCNGCRTPLGWNRALASLERKFSKEGYSEQMLKMLRLCQQCKQKALIGA
jgi:Pyruvate/2-oxoacid:ferredoxin oxidoreductase delta subunit